MLLPPLSTTLVLVLPGAGHFSSVSLTRAASLPPGGSFFWLILPYKSWWKPRFPIFFNPLINQGSGERGQEHTVTAGQEQSFPSEDLRQGEVPSDVAEERMPVL